MNVYEKYIPIVIYQAFWNIYIPKRLVYSHWNIFLGKSQFLLMSATYQIVHPLNHFGIYLGIQILQMGVEWMP